MSYYDEESSKVEIWLERLGYSKETIRSYIKNLKYFFNWIQKEKITNLDQAAIDQYLQYLHKKPIKSKTLQTKYNVIKHYDKYLEKTKNEKIITKPFELQDIDLPKKSEILTLVEIKKLYNSIEETIIGLRDRALLSLYYGCGLRNKEGAKVKIDDIDDKRSILEIRPSKNYQNRFIPLNCKVKEDLYKYQTQSRPYLVNKKTDMLLLNNKGNPLTTETARRIFNRLVEKAEINKEVTLHMLRHSLGTHLLKQGMQLEQIGQLLGHKSLNTTQLYARILK